MTTRFVGPNGSDANSGLSWALRKLTLTGVEATVAAGDLVYVAPGVYRETLTTLVSGSSGNVIAYIADITGVNTDGVGGIVRITGSDNDQTATRTTCISVSHNYRTWQGFSLDSVTSQIFNLLSVANVVIDKCALFSSNAHGIIVQGSTQSAITIRKCLIAYIKVHPILFSHSSTVSNAGHLVENCILYTPANWVINSTRVGGIIVRNSFLSGNNGLRIAAALAVGQTVTINNSIIANSLLGLSATALGEIVEDYNSFFANGTDRSNVAVGANSNAFIPGFQPPLIGVPYPQLWVMGALSEWSALRAIAGTSEPVDTLFDYTRPTASAKKSWGPMQFQDAIRATAQVHSGTYSIKLGDAARARQIVAVTAVASSISVWVYREANYAGTLPQLIVKQPGQADVVITDTGAAGQWNLLVATLTPAATPGYVVAELVSDNTATAGSFAVYFDDLAVN